MRIIRDLVAAVSALALSPVSPAAAGDFVSVSFEAGLVELSVSVTPFGGSTVSDTTTVPIFSNGASDDITLGAGDAGGDVFFDLSVNDNFEEAVLFLIAGFNAGQSDFGATVTCRARTLEPIVFRLTQELQFDVDTFNGDFTLTPVSGMIMGNVICPGTYSIEFDESLLLDPDEQFADFNAELFVYLQDSLEPEVRFTGAGDVNVTGQSFDDEGNEDNAFSPVTIESNLFSGGGGTSSGPVAGMAQMTGEISGQGAGSYNLTITADAEASQPVGYQGSCFIGALGDGVILELSKPKSFNVVNARGGSVSITPTTGSIDGNVLSPGRYSVSFNCSASIAPGEAGQTQMLDWTLQLFEPGCSAADLAPPSGVLDFSDVVAFLTAFAGADDLADLAPPTGQWDFSDVVAYLGLFAAGCP